MGGGASSQKKSASQAAPTKGEVVPTQPEPAAKGSSTAKDPPKPGPPVKDPPPPAAPAKPAYDGESSASKVVGGDLIRPKGPSPDDEAVFNEWHESGKLLVLKGVACCVPYNVTVVPSKAATTSGDDVASAAKQVLDVVFDEVEKVFSPFLPSSELSTINGLAVDALHVPSAAMKTVLDMAATLNRMTRGAFDPAVYPLAQFYRKASETGDYSEAATVAGFSKWSSFAIDASGIKKKHAEAKMDLCGLSKGWAIDEISKRLQAAGFSDTYVDWGGDIKVSGRHPAGRDWNVMVLEPPPLEEIGQNSAEDKKAYLAYISLQDGSSLATSGDYQQTLVGKLSHIIDPKTSRPVEITQSTLASVTVKTSASCMVADGLATAAMTLSEDMTSARRMLDTFHSGGLKDPVLDYVLYAREGPRFVRMRTYGQETSELRESRLGRHEAATVIVVGGGLAGVSAAIEAARARAKVYLVEKEDQLGGNSAKATSGINGWGSRVQYEQGIQDDQRYFERDTHSSGQGGKTDSACIQMLSAKASEAIHWLMDDLGVPLTVLSQLGGHSRKRTHRAPPKEDGTPVPIGYLIMQHAQAVAAATPGIEIKTGCGMTGLIKETVDGEEEVVGIEYTDKAGGAGQLRADAVVLTTGGWGFDKTENGLMAKYSPELLGIPTTNGSFAMGDAIKIASEAVGASLVDMDKVQLHPTAFIDPKDPFNHTKYLGPEALRGSGGILVSQTGERFCNELDLRKVVSRRITESCEWWPTPEGEKYRPWSWCILDVDAQRKFGLPQLRFYKDQVGLFEAAEDTRSLAAIIGCEEETLLKTLREYREAAKAGICSKTNKTVFPSHFEEENYAFVVARITPCIHYCMGGLEISSSAEVQKQADAQKRALGKREPVRRLFAAGEATGGVHGSNRLGGNSLLECVVFGRIAGERAGCIKQTSTDCLSFDEWRPVVLREIRTTDVKYGHNTRVYRFSLHGSLQKSGLHVGQFVAIRGELDGETLTGYYSPVSRPDDTGIISILCRTDDKGGPIVKLLTSLKPGSACMMKAMGGLSLIRQPKQGIWQYVGREVKQLSLLAGGTGLAPMLQITRAYIHALQSEDAMPSDGGVKLVYAAENAGDLAFVSAFEELKQRFPSLLSYFFVLNDPPPSWTQGIGFVDPDTIRSKLWFPPSDDIVNVICGPPIFEKIMCGHLSKLGYAPQQYYAFSNDPIT